MSSGLEDNGFMPRRGAWTSSVPRDVGGCSVTNEPHGRVQLQADQEAK